MPLPSLFLADILGVFVLQNLVYRFRSFVLRRRCAIVPQSYFHYQNCVQITFRYCFKFVQITHNSVLVCSFVYVYDVYCSQHVKSVASTDKSRLSTGKSW